MMVQMLATTVEGQSKLQLHHPLRLRYSTLYMYMIVLFGHEQTQMYKELSNVQLLQRQYVPMYYSPNLCANAYCL